MFHAFIIFIVLVAFIKLCIIFSEFIIKIYILCIIYDFVIIFLHFIITLWKAIVFDLHIKIYSFYFILISNFCMWFYYFFSCFIWKLLLLFPYIFGGFLSFAGVCRFFLFFIQILHFINIFIFSSSSKLFDQFYGMRFLFEFLLSFILIFFFMFNAAFC